MGERTINPSATVKKGLVSTWQWILKDVGRAQFWRMGWDFGRFFGAFCLGILVNLQDFFFLVVCVFFLLHVSAFCLFCFAYFLKGFWDFSFWVPPQKKLKSI